MIFHFSGFSKKYERHNIYNLEEIFPLIGPDQRCNFFNWYGVLGNFTRPTRLYLNSHRYLLFKREEHQLFCVKCGVAGLYFALERSVRRVAFQNKGDRRHQYRYESIKDAAWHFNLYGLHEDGTEIMLTVDHIVPRSKGGPNALWNYQLMCETCNARKGNVIELPASSLEVECLKSMSASSSV